MRSQTRFAFLFGSVAMAFLFASSATAQCGPTTCPVGPQSNGRSQIGNGLPLPITGAPAPTGEFLNANGRVGPTNSAFVTKTKASGTTMSPIALTFPVGQFKSPGPLVKLPVFLFNSKVFQVNTSLLISNPRVGDPAPTLMAGGRTGPAVVTWCPGSPIPTGTPMGTGNPGCLGPATNSTGGVTQFNGLARYTATKNQFGGVATGKTTGMNGGPACTAAACSAAGPRITGTANATVYHNVNGLPGTKLPCLGGATCQMAVSVPVPITNGNFGRGFTSTALVNPVGITLSAIRTGSIGTAGTILAIGAVVPTGGPFFNGAWPQQGVSSFGLPATTGMLTISVTGNPGAPEVFTRTGHDGRNAAGSGLLNTIGGGLSDRTFSGPNANRTWTTMYLPEPGALAAGASALMMLGGAHWLVRRRR